MMAESPLRNSSSRVDEDQEDVFATRLQNNDPSLTSLFIGEDGEFLPHEEEWGEAGVYLGGHEHLRELRLGSMGSAPLGSLRYMCQGLAKNRSIEKLVITSASFLTDSKVDALAPFLEQNTVRHLEIPNFATIGENDLSDDGLMAIGKLLSKFTSLTSVEINIEDGNDVLFEREAKSVVEALGGHPRLHSITLGGVFAWENCSTRKPAYKGSGALAALLNTFRSSLTVLKLRGIRTYCLASRLNKSHSSLTVLKLRDITSSCAATIGEAIMKKNGLQELSIASSYVPNAEEDCSKRGWGGLLGALKSRNCKLTSLSLRGNYFETHHVCCLAESFWRNTHLRELNLGYLTSYELSDELWQSLFAAILGTHSRIEKLDLSGNLLNDEAANALSNSLRMNNTLKAISLSDNPLISSTGWEAIFNVLRGSHSVLKKLNLAGNMNDERAIMLAQSLATNESVTGLKLDDDLFRQDNGITGIGWKAFSQVLCNSASILDVHGSNHTLGKIHNPTTSELKDLLRLNRKNSKGRAARLKILDCHFNGAIDIMQPLVNMDLEVLPHAVSWMAEKVTDTSRSRRNLGLSSLYLLARNVPSLFDIDSRNKKRKLANQHCAELYVE